MTRQPELLVVDDHEANRRMLARRLARQGFQVVEAGGGAEALTVVTRRPPALVLLDIEMPGLSGLDVLRRIREHHPATCLPVIIVTARTGSDDVVEALRLGANDYVTKPIDFPVAVARIHTQLAARAFGESLRSRDPLTGVGSAAAVRESVTTALAGKPSGSERLSLLVFDLDRFALINAVTGAAGGDQALRHCAGVLERACADRGVVGRLAGNRFAVVLPGCPGTEARTIAAAVLETLQAPLDLGGHRISLPASVGLVTAGAEPRSADDLLRDGDAAVAHAKSLGRQRIEAFVPALRHAAHERACLELELAAAGERGELEVWYQPIVSLASRRVNGFEALLRWRHPRRGLVPPGEFIPLAEQSGAIRELGEYVLRESCRQARVWGDRAESFGRLTMAVNLSGVQLSTPGFTTSAARALESSGLEPGLLNLELTESTLVGGGGEMRARLYELTALNVQLAVDDFGTGYSSLSMLHDLPVARLKIDRSFVARLGSHEADEIVATVMRLARGLGLEVVAEGIERAEQVDRLLQLGCNYGQGFLFARPMPGVEATAYLERHTPAGCARPDAA